MGPRPRVSPTPCLRGSSRARRCPATSAELVPFSTFGFLITHGLPLSAHTHTLQAKGMREPGHFTRPVPRQSDDLYDANDAPGPLGGSASRGSPPRGGGGGGASSSAAAPRASALARARVATRAETYCALNVWSTSESSAPSEASVAPCRAYTLRAPAAVRCSSATEAAAPNGDAIGGPAASGAGAAAPAACEYSGDCNPTAARSGNCPDGERSEEAPG